MRLEVADTCTEQIAERLLGLLQLGKADLFRVHGPVNLHRLSAIYDRTDRSDLKFKPFLPGLPARLEGKQDVFAALRRAGVAVALDTGFSRDVLDVLLQRLGWREGDPIDVTVASDEGARGRPFPDLIRIVMARTQVLSPRAVAKIGDTPADLSQGLAASCGLVVGVTYGTHTRHQLERPGVHLIDRLTDVLPLIAVEAVA